MGQRLAIAFQQIDAHDRDKEIPICHQQIDVCLPILAVFPHAPDLGVHVLVVQEVVIGADAIVECLEQSQARRLARERIYHQVGIVQLRANTHARPNVLDGILGDVVRLGEVDLAAGAILEQLGPGEKVWGALFCVEAEVVRLHACIFPWRERLQVLVVGAVILSGRIRGSFVGLNCFPFLAFCYHILG